MFSTVVSLPLMTQMPLPPEFFPAASIFARPPMPRNVRRFLGMAHTSPA